MTVRATGSPSRRAWVEQIMGMPVSVHVRGPRACVDPGVERIVADVFDGLRRVDALFSTYRPDSEIMRLNRGELRLRECNGLIREVADLCAEATERTDGYFTADLPVHDRSTPGLPAADRCRWFDPSGLVKGWAVERAARDLSAIDGHDYYLGAGGDIAAYVDDPMSPAWNVGVEDPLDRSRVLGALPIRSGGIATSGSAARGAHIINPRTGRPAGGDALAVTVVGPSVMWADVYATAAFARGADALTWLAGLEQTEGLIVAADGDYRSTPGFDLRPV
ncbi:FAD:protein FMN transferase [Frankia sp. Cppng1_Ct_nod]|uniref:FAD:protein FMN transferase n=1 Tax=Frankia sp. Cppng1_Ct_nod TaxID=2897162 RepID=UPI0020258ADD|nr:FAD:protein FMN transferase [Frankia sp. Cppng1_Ct_nod]